MNIDKKSQKEIKERLKQWKKSKDMLNKLKNDLNRKTILLLNGNEILVNIKELNLFVLSLEQALESLNEIEYQIVRHYFYDGWTDNKTMYELSLNRTTYYMLKRQALNKIVILSSISIFSD